MKIVKKIMRQKLTRFLLRHLLPVGLTTLCIFAIWVVGTLPIAAVFVIDDAFVISEYVQFLAYAISIAFGLSVLVLLPIASFGDKLAKRSKHAIWAYPGFVCLCTAAILIVRGFFSKSSLDALLDRDLYIVFIAFFFILYWAILWFEKALLAGWRRLRE